MKLLEKGNRITLFEGGIVVDENLLLLLFLIYPMTILIYLME